MDKFGYGKGPHNAEFFICMCGIHVHAGSYLISLLGIAFSILGIVRCWLSGDAWMAVASGIALICYICVYFAYSRENSTLYLPYIIIGTIELVYAITVQIGLMIGAFAYVLSPNDDSRYNSKDVAVAVLFFSLCLIVACAIQVYFVHVVYKAYIYTKEVLNRTKAPVATFHSASTTPATTPGANPSVGLGNIV